MQDVRTMRWQRITWRNRSTYFTLGSFTEKSSGDLTLSAVTSSQAASLETEGKRVGVTKTGDAGVTLQHLRKQLVKMSMLQRATESLWTSKRLQKVIHVKEGRKESGSQGEKKGKMGEGEKREDRKTERVIKGSGETKRESWWQRWREGDGPKDRGKRNVRQELKEGNREEQGEVMRRICLDLPLLPCYLFLLISSCYYESSL